MVKAKSSVSAALASMVTDAAGSANSLRSTPPKDDLSGNHLDLLKNFDAPPSIELTTDNGPDIDQDAAVPSDVVQEVKEAIVRPPPVNSSYLPLPWKGRLGYACLCTYLRTANPPVFCSRTCRISTVLEHRHPLRDPSQPPHQTKNRPDTSKPPDVARGLAYVQGLGMENARDIIKMLRWNERYGIKFLRLSSEMFPFASHLEHGYKLEPFASGVLGEAGRVAGELGHRLTTHPGQYTQLGSPRKAVIENSIRDLEYHAEMLRLLKLPPQQDRDAVMILHMGGVFGSKTETLGRFKKNYMSLSQDAQNRLVLENDDVSWTVHDLLPVCEEMNIPFVLDYHHHNINFDSDKIREGTLDIIQLYDRIKATWTKKGITQKMHYSESLPSAITNSQRRKHNPRVQMLPPCDQTMDLMIEAKDKEQAVFELMKTYKLPGFDRFNDVIPYMRTDVNKIKNVWTRNPAKNGSSDTDPSIVPEDEVGMGGPDGRVYWPPGMEHYLRPEKNFKANVLTEQVGGHMTDSSKRATRRTKTTKSNNGTAASAPSKVRGKRKKTETPSSDEPTTPPSSDTEDPPPTTRRTKARAKR